MSRLPLLTMLTIIAGLFPRCNQSTVSGTGGSSETINAMLITDGTTVSVETINGNDSFELQVFEKNYHPFEKTGYTGSSRPSGGTPSVTVEVEGLYNAYVTAASGAASCFLTDIAVRADSSAAIACTLTAMVRIEGTLVSVEAEPVAGDYAVSVYGSPFFCTTGNTPGFTFDTIPAGEYRVSIRPIAKRLFVATANYTITAAGGQPITEVRVELPRP
jgi:hypothetical protein